MTETHSLLLVDHDDSTMAMTAQDLRAAGYRVQRVVGNAEEATHTTQFNGIELVVIVLSSGNAGAGAQTARTILQDHNFPILFLAAGDDPALLSAVEGIPRYGYVVKGSSTLQLKAAIDGAIELHRAHRQTQQNEARWQYALEGAGDGAWDWDFQANHIFLSDQMKRLLALWPETQEFNWRDDFIARLDPDVYQAMIAQLEQHILGKIPAYEIEFRIAYPDGSSRWLSARGKITERTPEGAPLRMIGTLSDIDQRKRSEEALRKSEQGYRFLFENLPIPVFTKDLEGRYISCNPEALRYWSHDPVGSRDDEMLPPEAAANMMAADRKVIESGQSLNGIEVIKFSPLGERHFFTRKVAIRDQNGAVAGVLGASIDVTEQVETTITLRSRLMLHEYSANHTLKQLLQATLDEAETLTNSNVGFYHFVSEEQGTLTFQAWSSRTESVSCQLNKARIHDQINKAGIWVDCIRQRRPVIHNDITSVKEYQGLPEGHVPITRELVAPVFRDGRIVAILGIGNKPTDYDEHDVHMVTLLADLAWDITEHKRNTEALRENEQKYRLLFENMTTAFALHQMIYDEQGHPVNYRYLEANPAFEKLTGLPIAGLIGRTILEIMPDIEPYWIETFGRVAMTGIPVTYENYSRTLGRYYDTLAFSPAKDQVAVIFSNVTERKLNEDAVRIQRDLGLALSSITDLQQVCQLVLQAGCQIEGVDCGMVSLVDENSSTLNLVAHHNLSEDFVATTGQFSVGSPQWKLLMDGRPHYGDYNQISPEPIPARTREGLRASAMIPVSHEGRLIAVIGLASHNSESFSASVRAAMEGIAMQAGGILARIQAENRLKEAEKALEKRIVALTQPLDDPAGVTFEDLFDLAEIQQMQDKFSEATGVSSLIVHPDGTPITSASKSSRLCREILRKNQLGLNHCVESDARINERSLQAPALQHCLGVGLWTAAASIKVGHYHIANWLIGQVRDSTQSEEHVRAYAQKIGADEESLLEAYREIPAMSNEQFQKIADAQFTLAHQLSTMAFQNVQQARFIAGQKRTEEALRKSESKFRSFIEQNSEGFMLIDENGILIEWNQAMERMIGIPASQAVGRPAWKIQAQMIAGKATPERIDYLKTQLLRTLQGENSEPFKQPVTIVIERKDGHQIFIQQTAFPIHTGDNLQIGTVTRDITQAKHFEQEIQLLNQELLMAYDATIEGWASALELRNQETVGHSRRVVNLTVALATQLGVPAGQLENIRRGAILHDIGKMGIPDAILLKPGPLDDQEWELMHQHPTHAYRMLSRIPFLLPAVDVPYCHHEQWDGKGYPRGLKGAEIPLAARIFTVVDVWDALTNQRPYRAAWSEDDALSFICSESGSMFDPAVVNAFTTMINKNGHSA